jgi:hypothetical protein
MAFTSIPISKTHRMSDSVSALCKQDTPYSCNALPGQTAPCQHLTLSFLRGMALQEIRKIYCPLSAMPELRQHQHWPQLVYTHKK